MIKVDGKFVESMKDIGVEAINEKGENIGFPQNTLHVWDNGKNGFLFLDGIEIDVKKLPEHIQFVRVYNGC